MIFATHQAPDKIAKGIKTQTRRTRLLSDIGVSKDNGIVRVYSGNGRVRYDVGKTYGVQTGRGQPILLWLPGDPIYEPCPTDMPLPNREQWQPFRIRIVKIREEDARDITHEDAIAEGFSGQMEFWRVWCGMYDKAVLQFSFNTPEEMRLTMLVRPDAAYRCWALDIAPVLPDGA